MIAEGELVPIPCGRNDCPYCRPRNVQVTAAMMGLNATLSAKPVRTAVLSTTREWVDEDTLRNGWKDVARRVRSEVDPEAGYAWFREWTRGKSDGVRRTHYHSTWTCDCCHGEALAEISRDVWSRLAGAYSEKAHGAKPIWDAGGLTRYVAGLAGHHLKSGQAPPPGWTGRRFGTSKGFYAIPADELRSRAAVAVRDERLVHRMTQALWERWPGDEDGPGMMDVELYDERLTELLELERAKPRVRVVRVRPGLFV